MTDDEIPLPRAQQTELDRRLATFETDRAPGVFWEDLKARLAGVTDERRKR